MRGGQEDVRFYFSAYVVAPAVDRRRAVPDGRDSGMDRAEKALLQALRARRAVRSTRLGGGGGGERGRHSGKIFLNLFLQSLLSRGHRPVLAARSSGLWPLDGEYVFTVFGQRPKTYVFGCIGSASWVVGVEVGSRRANAQLGTEPGRATSPFLVISPVPGPRHI